ncbi:hypothetical protein E8E13_002951 [Curvularia kusanoi]|uniref:Pre-mRNA-splicing factor 38 n=1 Tax=Curvularia kusanoi TaxID=90978 RepID=A0A9P4TLQ5_CURKU|nr:hypothetical protein E8E13_002951 [Curvularia kusanoi]
MSKTTYDRADASAMLDERGYSGQLIRGQNPALLFEKGVRERITESYYWKEQCFGLNAATLCDRAVELKFIGGTSGITGRPTPFLCLAFKMLQLVPEKEIVLEMLNFHDDDEEEEKDEDGVKAEEVKQEENGENGEGSKRDLNAEGKLGTFKYLRCLAAFYIRLAWDPVEIYTTLEPLLTDYRKIKRRLKENFSLTYVDQFIDDLLTKDRICATSLWKLPSRAFLEEEDKLEPRESPLDGEVELLDDEDERYLVNMIRSLARLVPQHPPPPQNPRPPLRRPTAPSLGPEVTLRHGLRHAPDKGSFGLDYNDKDLYPSDESDSEPDVPIEYAPRHAPEKGSFGFDYDSKELYASDDSVSGSEVDSGPQPLSAGGSITSVTDRSQLSGSHSLQPVATSQPHLLTLPREIRDMIYGYLTQDRQLPLKSISQVDGFRTLVEIKKPPYVDVLLTHSRLRDEYLQSTCFKDLSLVIYTCAKYEGLEELGYHLPNPPISSRDDAALAHAKRVDLICTYADEREYIDTPLNIIYGLFERGLSPHTLRIIQERSIVGELDDPILKESAFRAEQALRLIPALPNEVNSLPLRQHATGMKLILGEDQGWHLTYEIRARVYSARASEADMWDAEEASSEWDWPQTEMRYWSENSLKA